jgi:uncharacterized protein
MEFIGIAILMGLAGSLHCIGMCGPLHAAIPFNRSTNWKHFQSRLLNHSGRLLTYAILGSMAGLIGKGMVAAGAQQWLSIASGIIILLLVFFYYKSNSGWLARLSSGFVSKIKIRFSSLLKHKTNRTFFLLGVLNGLLPCGLVYFALAAATATGTPVKGALFMFIFGLGTVPALLSFGGVLEWLKTKTKVNTARWIRVTLLISGALLILRGSNLGIPYLSPKVEKAKMSCCHKPE